MMNDDDDDFKIFNNKARHFGKLQEPKKPRPPYADPATTGSFITPSLSFFFRHFISSFFFPSPTAIQNS